MFFGKKRKTYASSRFQNRNFGKKVALASKYKRTIQRKPESKAGIFLTKIGLGSWWSRALVVAVLMFLLYITYVPNFLFIKSVNVKGADSAASEIIKNEVNNFFAEHTLWPQKNILFLNKSKLATYLLERDPSVLQIISVKKHLWNSVTLEIKPRKETFVLNTSNSKFILYNDGVTARELELSQTVQGGLFAIQVMANQKPKTGDHFLTAPLAEQLQGIYASFKDKTSFAIDYVEFPIKVEEENSSAENNSEGQDIVKKTVEHINLNDLAVNVKRNPESKDPSKDFKVLLNLQEGDVHKTIENAGVILKQLAPEKLAALYYLDMRFKDKGYACLKNTPCADSFQFNILPKNPPTDEPESSIQLPGDKEQ